MRAVGVSATDAAVLLGLEERLAMPAASELRESLGALLAEDFQEIGSSGHLWDGAAVLDALQAGGRPRIVLEEFKVTAVADGAVLVTYVSRSVAGAGWKPPARRSSLWCRRAGRWQLLFHQGTPLSAEEGA